jgi:manganese/zinc/iron transport system ATP- binding protein
MSAIPAPRPTILRVDDLSVVYDEAPVLEGVSFHVHAGDRLAIIGPNGAGKSTLVKAMLGLLKTHSGAIHVDGDPQRMGYVAQHDQLDWDFPVSVLDAVVMGMWREVGWLRLPGRRQRERAERALERVGLGAVAGRQIGELSGGQRRRVFIARALAQQADILILDEPFAGVDVSAEAEMLAVLRRLNDEGITLIVCTHDLEQAREQFNKVLALRKKMIAFGSPQQVFTKAHLADLFGRRVVAFDGGEPQEVFIDEHACGDC